MFTAEQIMVAVTEALLKNPGADVVYVHNEDGTPFAAIIRGDSPAWEALPDMLTLVYPDELMVPHDHIEPGMF